MYRKLLEETQAKYDFVSFPLDERPDDYVKNIYPAGRVSGKPLLRGRRIFTSV